MKPRTCLLIVAILSLCGMQISLAGNESKKGTAGAQELLLPIGARGIALGGSNASTVRGIEAIHWNPAGLALINGRGEALFSHMNYIADIGVNFGAVAVNIEDLGTLALSLKSLDFGDIPVTTEDSPEGAGETFSPSFAVIGLSYARSLTDRISVGANFKLISEKIVRTAATGLAFDAGVQYAFGSDTPLSGVRFAVTLKNLGPTMQYDGPDLERNVVPPGTAWNNTQRALKYTSQAFELPSTLELGVSYDFLPTESNRLTLNTLFQNTNFGNDEYKGGLEYAFNEQFFVRGGYLYSPEGNKNSSIYGVSAGAGINLDIGGVRAQLDYAYRETKYFQGTNTIGVLLGF